MNRRDVLMCAATYAASGLATTDGAPASADPGVSHLLVCELCAGVREAILDPGTIIDADSLATSTYGTGLVVHQGALCSAARAGGEKPRSEDLLPGLSLSEVPPLGCFGKVVEKSMPGFAPVGAVAIRAEDRCSVLTALAKTRERLAREFVTESRPSRIPLAYARLAGQRFGDAGVLYVEAGLGGPREGFMPPYVLVRSWREFRDILGATPGEWNDQLRIVEAPPDKVVRTGGPINTESFDPADIPRWADALRAPKRVVP